MDKRARGGGSTASPLPLPLLPQRLFSIGSHVSRIRRRLNSGAQGALRRSLGQEEASCCECIRLRYLPRCWFSQLAGAQLYLRVPRSVSSPPNSRPLSAPSSHSVA